MTEIASEAGWLFVNDFLFCMVLAFNSSVRHGGWQVTEVF